MENRTTLESLMNNSNSERTEQQSEQSGQGPILKKGSYQKLTQAQTIISNAEEKRKIYFEESHATGFDQGLQEATAYFVEMKQTQTIEADKLENQINHLILDLINDIVGKIECGQQAAQSARQAMKQLGLRDGLILRVPPTAVEAAETQLSDLPESIIKIIPDPSAEDGESYLETPYGHIALSIEQQIAAIREGLSAPTSNSDA